MSQGVEIVLVIQGLAGLAQAVTEAGAELIRERRKVKNAQGQLEEVAGVIRDQDGTEVGVKLDEQTGQAVFVGHDETGKAKALAGRVAQRYAYTKVTEELRKKGYQIAREEKQADGTVKVVLSKWS
ncbi:DUF1257 domain-containing protein [Anaeromyxobacter paludicola]|uniref:DUF1257 domain-containing protein n=1 Tax=Anaeromyxobacter paludicola TaxID=2918171 RepID=A0ABM7XC48_9BACT|nr:DUF1257 domain-containing protein [Anaeromyxobacter paludicola]BDG09441.1 hypothetical protein AMPC_25540 [Anaeromyxobacter paludicola]